MVTWESKKAAACRLPIGKLSTPSDPVAYRQYMHSCQALSQCPEMLQLLRSVLTLQRCRSKFNSLRCCGCVVKLSLFTLKNHDFICRIKVSFSFSYSIRSLSFLEERCSYCRWRQTHGCAFGFLRNNKCNGYQALFLRLFCSEFYLSL